MYAELKKQRIRTRTGLENAANDGALIHFYRQKGDCCTPVSLYDAVTGET
jgi:hypothetical protein